MTPQCLVKSQQGIFLVRIMGSFDLLEYIGVGTYGALAKYNQTARQNVGTLNCNANRYLLISACHVIVRPHANTFATVHIHRIDDGDTAAIGTVEFCNGRNHGRFFTHIYRRSGKYPNRLQHINIPADTRQCLFHTFKLTHRYFELFAHPAIGTTCACRQFCTTGCAGRQRNGTARSKTFHQHAPALANTFGTADDVIKRDKYILACGRAILESRI